MGSLILPEAAINLCRTLIFCHIKAAIANQSMIKAWGCRPCNSQYSLENQVPQLSRMQLVLTPLNPQPMKSPQCMGHRKKIVLFHPLPLENSRLLCIRRPRTFRSAVTTSTRQASAANISLPLPSITCSSQIRFLKEVVVIIKRPSSTISIRISSINNSRIAAILHRVAVVNTSYLTRLSTMSNSRSIQYCPRTAWCLFRVR